MNGFTSVKNSFIADPRFTATEKMILIWLASKPADWQVREEQVQKELGIGRDVTRRMLRALRDQGAITRPAAVHGADGRWSKSPSQLAIRDEIRYVSAGHTEGGFSGVRSDQGKQEFPQVTPNVGFPASGEPASGFPAHTTNEGTTNEGTTKESTPKSIQDDLEGGDVQTLSKAVTRRPADDDIPPFMRGDASELPEPAVAGPWTDESLARELRRLVREAPDVKALRGLWEHRKAEFDAEVTELAKARKAQLLSA